MGILACLKSASNWGRLVHSNGYPSVDQVDLAFVANYNVGSAPEIAQYGPFHLPWNVFTASKGSCTYVLLIMDVFILKAALTSQKAQT